MEHIRIVPQKLGGEVVNFPRISRACYLTKGKFLLGPVIFGRER